MSGSETSRSSNVGQFVLCIEGLPHSYTWQDVKDLARNRVEHGIRAEVTVRTGSNGEKVTVHLATVSRRNEANDLYDWLTTTQIEQRLLRVHLMEGSVCIKSNCHLFRASCPSCRPGSSVVQPPANRPTVSALAWAAPSPMAMSTNGYNANLGPAMNRIPPPQQTAPYQYAPTQQAQPQTPQSPLSDPAMAQQIEVALRARKQAGNSLLPTQEEFLKRMAAMRLDSMPAHYNQHSQQQHQQQQHQPLSMINGAAPPILAAAASGSPINTAYGYARTEARGVFVSGLNFKTKSQDLVDLFSKAGTVKKCQLHADSRGNGKGTATIEFATASEASQAIKVLDNLSWKGRTLRVRSDRETVVVKAPAMTPAMSTASGRDYLSEREADREPIIVNGSNSRQARRDSKITFSS